MAVRNIININEDLCNGCGECITACAEGALQIVHGKAKLVRDIYCDGLGACLGGCPTGALTIERREAEEFSEEAVEERQSELNETGEEDEEEGGCHGALPCGCPGSMARSFAEPAPENQNDNAVGAPMPSALTQWPIQLHLVHPADPQFRGRELLIAADCTPFAFGDFHRRMLKGSKLLIACPKLDNTRGYLEKLSAIFTAAKPPMVRIARMEVPCCGGLVQLVSEARRASGLHFPVQEIIIGVQGQILSEKTLASSK